MIDKLKNNLIICISIIIVLFALYMNFIPTLSLTIMFKLLLYGFSMLLIFIDMKIKTRKVDEEGIKEKIRIKGLSIIFIMYSIFIATFLILDNNYRRLEFTFIDKINLFSKEHFEYYSNFIPFSTIGDYMNRVMQGTINIDIALLNIVGNIIMFVPFGLFLPIIFREKINSIKKFTLVMLVIVLIVECVQFITMKGSFDVDDIILNVLGAVMGYGIIKIKVIRNIIDNILK